MEPLLLGTLGLVVGAALSPVTTALAAWPDERTDHADTPAGGPHATPAHQGGSGLGPLGLVRERPRQTAVLSLATGGIFAAAALRYDSAAETAVVLAYAAALVVCAATDLLTFRVPNAVTYPAIAAALVAAAFMPGADLGKALAGGAAGGGLLLAMALVTRGGIGLGDAKLAAFAGLALGWPILFSALMITAVAGGVAAAAALLLGLRRRTDPLPYAPFIAGAAVAVLLWQGAVFHQL